MTDTADVVVGNQEDYSKLCDSFFSMVEDSTDEDFSDGGAVAIGNEYWNIILYPTDYAMKNIRQPLMFLFSSRKDLVRSVVSSHSPTTLMDSTYKLGTWLEHHGYTLGIQGKNLRGRASLLLINVVSTVYEWFNRKR